MRVNSLLDIISTIELELGIYLDAEQTRFTSIKEEKAYREQLTESISELNEELTNLVSQIETTEPRTQNCFKKFKSNYRVSINYVLNELTEYEPIYSRFEIGLDKVKQLKFHFH